MGHVEVGPHPHVAVDGVVEAELDFKALALGAAEVGRGSAAAEVAGDGAVGALHEDVLTLVLEDFDGACEHVVEEAVVDAEVHLGHLLPVCVGVAHHRLVVEGVGAGVAGTGRAVDDGVATECPLVHVEPAVAGVVADFAVAGADFQVVDVGQEALEEGLAADTPADSARVEEAEAVALAEFLGAVVGAVVFNHVAAVEAVGGTEHPVLAVAGDFAAVSVFLAGPYAGGAYVVLASELAAPVELQLIVDVALGLAVLDFAGVLVEAGVGVVVEVGEAVVGVFLHSACGGIDPSACAGCAGRNLDASLALYEEVVPRNHAAEIEALGDEAEVLLKHEVGVDACGGHAHGTGREKVAHGVGGLCGVQRVVADGAVAVAGHEDVGSGAVDRAPDLGCTPVDGVHACAVVRGLARCVGAGHVHLEGGGGGDGEVEVRTHVETVVGEARVEAAVGVEAAEEVTLVHEVDSRVVAHELGAASDVDVGVVAHGVVLEELVLPVHVGVALDVLDGGAVAVLVDAGLGDEVAPRCGAEREFVLNHAVVQHEGVIRVVFVGKTGDGLHGGGEAYVDLGLAFGTALGGDEDDAVGALHTVHGGGRCVLEGRD